MRKTKRMFWGLLLLGSLVGCGSGKVWVRESGANRSDFEECYYHARMICKYSNDPKTIGEALGQGIFEALCTSMEHSDCMKMRGYHLERQ